MKNPKAVFIVSTFSTDESASTIGRNLVERGLCACVNLTEVRSIYFWDGKVEDHSEIIALFKVACESAGAFKKELSRIHPYKVPEIVEIKLSDVSKPYLSWLVKNSTHRIAKKRNHSAERRHTQSNVS